MCVMATLALLLVPLCCCDNYKAQYRAYSVFVALQRVIHPDGDHTASRSHKHIAHFQRYMLV